jgi:SAM-dependent methyltransferase
MTDSQPSLQETAALKEYYEKDAERFWNPRAGMTGRDRDVYPMLAEARGTLLEYGFGAGSLLLNLAMEERFVRAWGFELADRAIEMAQAAWVDMSAQGARKLTLARSVGDRMPQVPDGSVDACVCVAVVEHVLDPYTLLDEIHRVSRPGALLVCSVPNYAYLKHRFQLLCGVQPRTGTDAPVSEWRREGWDGMHLHTFTKSSFTTLLRDCGWEPERWRGAGSRLNWLGIGPLRRSFPGLWSGELIALCRRRCRN